MSDNESKRIISTKTTFDKIVFAGSIVGVIFLLVLTFYKNHISKEMVIENYQLKKSVAEKDSVIKQQQIYIDSLLKK